LVSARGFRRRGPHVSRASRVLRSSATGQAWLIAGPGTVRGQTRGCDYRSIVGMQNGGTRGYYQKNKLYGSSPRLMMSGDGDGLSWVP
jgi:hypothetical protein